MIGINAALAMTFVLLLKTGLISLAIAAFWGIGAYASALLSMRLGLPVWACLPLATAFTGFIAWVVGFILVRNSGFGFIIPSLVFGFIIYQALGSLKVFGGHIGIINIPPPETIALPFLPPIVFDSKAPFYYLMLILVGLTVLVLSAFYAAWTGRAWRAAGLSPALAESLGIDLFKYRLLAFVLAGLVAGLMGSFFAHYFGTLIPSSFGPFKTIDIHVIAILGGVGSAIAGPIVGSFIMTLVPEVLRVTEGFEPIITGLLIVLLVMFLPEGILGLLDAVRSGESLSARTASARKRIGSLFLGGGTAREGEE
jgi:branched-chain amino acid transport system permease protein